MDVKVDITGEFKKAKSKFLRYSLLISLVLFLIILVNVLTITCKWYDGLFRNDYYVIGAIVDAEDLKTILDRLQI